MGYTELGPIAHAVGSHDPGTKGEIRIVRGGHHVQIALRIDSGVVRGVDLVIDNRGWPEAVFRPETDDDRASKRGGMNVEVQTGDPTFDDFVYIESPYGQAVLAPLLQSPALRHAIGELVARYGPVEISKQGLTVKTHRGGTELLLPDRFLPLLDGLIRVANLLPPVPAGAPKTSERGGGLMIASAALFFAGAFAPAFIHYGNPVSAMLRVTGIGVGVVAAIVAIPLVRLYTRGHSRSTTYFRVTSIALALALPLTFMSAIVVVNAALDTAPPERLAGKVTVSANYLDDGEPRVKATIAWTNRTTEVLDLKDPRPVPARVGDDVTAIRRQGALGFSWWELEPTIKR